MLDERVWVLVIDDNAISRNLVAFRLKKQGFDIICAEDGEQALDITEALVRSLINQWRSDRQVVAFVPTMGNLHDGHVRLVETAKANNLDPYYYLKYLFTELPQVSSRVVILLV